MTLIDYYGEWVAYRQWVLRVPGVQVAVRREGELVVDAAHGVADLGSGVPLTTRHLFRIASHSKTVAAVAVLQLARDGRLRLDDPVLAHVPDLAGSPVATRTLRELLAHGGGVIRDSEDGDFWQLGRVFPDRGDLLRIASSPSAAVLPRNERFKYSNIAYGLLGLVLEAVTGHDFATHVRTAVAGPLGLADLGGEYDPARAAEFAAGHSALTTGLVRRVLDHVDTRALAAATGCYATAADLTAFYDALRRGDERLLDADGLREQRHAQWEIKAGERRYGLGVFVDTVAGATLFGHTGGYPGHITCTHADADDDHADVVSVLTNAIDGPASPLAAAWFHLRRLGAEATHRPAADAARFTGRFADLWGVTDVVELDGRLFALDPTLAQPAEDAVALETVDATTLRIVGGRGGNSVGELMRYEFAADGTVARVRGESGMTHLPFTVPSG
ncbi:MAG: serine hydrolase domain-containing protein [Jatrophihabitans sp.]|uniref:serine hydrolase domain-containing protein n=1 Tax=Jatrophihabitans sp. TaxID=1932789 RepID=UPI003F7DF5AC